MIKNLQQQTLNLCLRDDENFNNFFAGRNGQLVEILRGLHTDHAPLFVYFWGKSASGKSHLLNAVCQRYGEQSLLSSYLPLEDAGALRPEILDDLATLELLCIDDLHLVAGNLAWEERIFHCFNQRMEGGKQIVIAANASPYALQLQLPDLKSRMASGLIFELYALNDAEKIESLKMRAKLRGLELNDLVAQFLLNHCERNPKNLFDVLEKLDKAALVAQRRLTIPFVKDILGDI